MPAPAKAETLSVSPDIRGWVPRIEEAIRTTPERGELNYLNSLTGMLIIPPSSPPFQHLRATEKCLWHFQTGLGFTDKKRAKVINAEIIRDEEKVKTDGETFAEKITSLLENHTNPRQIIAALNSMFQLAVLADPAILKETRTYARQIDAGLPRNLGRFFRETAEHLTSSLATTGVSTIRTKLETMALLSEQITDPKWGFYSLTRPTNCESIFGPIKTLIQGAIDHLIALEDYPLLEKEVNELANLLLRIYRQRRGSLFPDGIIKFSDWFHGAFGEQFPELTASLALTLRRRGLGNFLTENHYGQWDIAKQWMRHQAILSQKPHKIPLTLESKLGIFTTSAHFFNEAHLQIIEDMICLGYTPLILVNPETQEKPDLPHWEDRLKLVLKALQGINHLVYTQADFPGYFPEKWPDQMPTVDKQKTSTAGQIQYVLLMFEKMGITFKQTNLFRFCGLDHFTHLPNGEFGYPDSEPGRKFLHEINHILIAQWRDLRANTTLSDLLEDLPGKTPEGGTISVGFPSWLRLHSTYARRTLLAFDAAIGAIRGAEAPREQRVILTHMREALQWAKTMVHPSIWEDTMDLLGLSEESKRILLSEL